MAISIPHRRIPLQGYSLTIDDIARIFDRLHLVIKEQGDIEVAKLTKPVDMAEDVWKKKIESEANQAFRCTVTIAGVDGSSLFGDYSDMFFSSIRPENIRSVYMTNKNAYRGVSGRNPLNSFELFLDFSRPPLLEADRLVSAPTENESNLSIEGESDSWISAIEGAVIGVLKDRKNGRMWLHRGFVYDILLFTIVFPINFWICWRISPIISASGIAINGFVEAAFYLYVFLVLAFSFRFLFGYTKWAFPITEYLFENSNTARHQRAWCVVSLGIVSTLLYDILF